jgi:carbamoyl-phosphate synthase large subunit
MKSTGEVMGIGTTFGEAFFKAQLGASVRVPRTGLVYIRVRKDDQARAVALARRLDAAGFNICASLVTAAVISAAEVPVNAIGDNDVLARIASREVSLVVLTVEERRTASVASRPFRVAALAAGVVTCTTIAAAEGVCEAMGHVETYSLASLQDLHRAERRELRAPVLPVPSQDDIAAAATSLPERRTRTRQRSVGVAPLKLFIRQPFTESDEVQQQLIGEIMHLIDSANGLPHPFDYLTGNKAESAATFKKSFERDHHQPFTPRNFRNHRLGLLAQADAVVNIRVGMSESSAFELAYHIYKGRCTPVLFLVWKQAPIKTTLIRELEDVCDVTYIEFDDVNELRAGIHKFFSGLQHAVGKLH